MKELMHLIEKISKRMLKRGRGLSVSPNLSGKTINTIISDYNSTKSVYKVNLNRNMQKLINKQITYDEFVALQHTEIREAFTNAYTLGKRFGTGDLTLNPDGQEMRSLNVLITNELDYMKNFGNDIVNGAGRMRYSRRLQMYVDSLNATFNYGRAVYIPENTKIYWTLGITDKHCNDCIIIAASNPYTKKTLPSIPKSGHTECLANCLCSLVYSNTSSVEEQEYVDLLTNIPQNTSKEIPTKEDYRHLVDLRDDYYYNTYMFDMTKDPAYNDSAIDSKRQFDKHISKNNLSFPLFFRKKEALRELRMFSRHTSFNLITDSTMVKPKDMLSVFLGARQIYGAVERVDGKDILVKTIEGLIFTVSPDRNVIFKGI